jgi:bifunctional non-homologous end joining protein LigD
MHRNENGIEFFKEACEKGWEGIIAKRANSRYVHKRSTDWLKFKCIHGQELVIVGYTEPKGGRRGFGALLLGYYDDDELLYAGKVGTGFTDKVLSEMIEQLRGIRIDSSPFKDHKDGKDVHWVSPELVGEIEFTEWTRDNRLRHPRFKGLRFDKDPKDVTREG